MALARRIVASPLVGDGKWDVSSPTRGDATFLNGLRKAVAHPRQAFGVFLSLHRVCHALGILHFVGTLPRRVRQVVLPAMLGGSPAAGKRQVNVPLAWNNDLPYGLNGSLRSQDSFRAAWHGPNGRGSTDPYHS